MKILVNGEPARKLSHACEFLGEFHAPVNSSEEVKTLLRKGVEILPEDPEEEYQSK